jgi:hypothetical protein
VSRGQIKRAFAEWLDDEQAFVVLLEREGENEPQPLRVLRFNKRPDDDPVETRLAWDVMIYCLKDVADGDARDDFFKFDRRARADRVAKRCNRTLKDIADGVPPLEGMAAQIACMSKGGAGRGRDGRVPGFCLDNLRGRIA